MGSKKETPGRVSGAEKTWEIHFFGASPFDSGGAAQPVVVRAASAATEGSWLILRDRAGQPVFAAPSVRYAMVAPSVQYAMVTPEPREREPVDPQAFIAQHADPGPIETGKP